MKWMKKKQSPEYLCLSKTAVKWTYGHCYCRTSIYCKYKSPSIVIPNYFKLNLFMCCYSVDCLSCIVLIGLYRFLSFYWVSLFYVQNSECIDAYYCIVKNNENKQSLLHYTWNYPLYFVWLHTTHWQILWLSSSSFLGFVCVSCFAIILFSPFIVTFVTTSEWTNKIIRVMRQICTSCFRIWALQIAEKCTANNHSKSDIHFTLLKSHLRTD